MLERKLLPCGGGLRTERAVHPWQPVVWMEEQALLRLMQRAQGPIDVTMDCLAATRILRKVVPPEDGEDRSWEDRKRAATKWVASHKTEAELVQKSHQFSQFAETSHVRAACDRQCKSKLSRSTGNPCPFELEGLQFISWV